MEIALRIVQFWSEIKLVITNRTPASRSCDFVITRLISDQIALHSVQLPLLIALFLTNQIAGNTIDFKMDVITKETSRAEPEYMNIHAPISVLAPALYMLMCLQDIFVHLDIHAIIVKVAKI